MTRRTHLFRIVGTALMVLLIAACTTPSETTLTGDSGVVHVVNVDGPGVSVLLGAKVVATVPCGGAATITQGSELGALPLDLVVRAPDGAILGIASITGPLPRGILIRGRSVLTGPWPMSYGPAPSPFEAPCGTAAAS